MTVKYKKYPYVKSDICKKQYSGDTSNISRKY